MFVRWKSRPNRCRPPNNAGGAKWTYCDGATALLGRLIAKGTGDKLHDYAVRCCSSLWNLVPAKDDWAIEDEAKTLGLEWDELTIPYGDPGNGENVMEAVP